MWRGALVLGASIASAGVIACGLTADFSGLQGGSRGGPDVTDAGSDATDASASKGFCASRPTSANAFCADFDDGPKSLGYWSASDTTDGQTVSVDSAVSFSPPNSFLSEIDSTGTNASARLRESLPLRATRVRIEFQMRLEAQAGRFELCAVHQDSAEGVSYGLFYKLEDGKLLAFLKTRSGETVLEPTFGPPNSGWVHVEIDLELADAGSIVIKHDGEEGVHKTGITTLIAGRTKLFVDLGFYSFDAAQARAHFDDVIIEWTTP